MNSSPHAVISRARQAFASLLVMGILVAPRFARADEPPEVYLTWHAPWGEPGATDTLTASCDTSRTDTLWLAVKLGKSSPTMMGVEATLLFHPAPGESLSSVWRSSFIEEKPVILIIDAHPDPGLGYPQMFKINGEGIGSLDMLGAAGRLRIDYATPAAEAVSVSDRQYAFARITVKRPPPGDPRCGEPICVDWSEVELGFSSKDDHTIRTHGPHRFVSLNSPGGAILATFREGERHSWRPPGAH